MVTQIDPAEKPTGVFQRATETVVHKGGGKTQEADRKKKICSPSFVCRREKRDHFVKENLLFVACLYDITLYLTDASLRDTEDSLCICFLGVGTLMAEQQSDFYGAHTTDLSSLFFKGI